MSIENNQLLRISTAGSVDDGKSTLIGQWIDEFSLPYTWYSLDKSDNDISNFLQYLEYLSKKTKKVQLNF